MKFSVRVIPRAKKTEYVGEYAEGIKIKISAPPLDGKANDELVKFLSKKLSLSRSGVRVISGQTSRDKILEADVPENFSKEDFLKLLES